MSPPFRRILVTTDLSEDASRAFPRVAELARAAGAEVTLLHVVHEVVIPPTSGMEIAAPLHAPESEEQRVEAAARLAELAAQHFAGIAAETCTLSRTSAAEAITSFAREQGHDLIAMSTHGRSGLGRLVLGSVAEAVLRHADVPVLLFPRNAH